MSDRAPQRHDKAPPGTLLVRSGFLILGLLLGSLLSQWTSSPHAVSGVSAPSVAEAAP